MGTVFQTSAYTHYIGHERRGERFRFHTERCVGVDKKQRRRTTKSQEHKRRIMSLLKRFSNVLRQRILCLFISHLAAFEPIGSKKASGRRENIEQIDL